MEKHDKLKEILQKYGNPEFGDAIVDEICELFGYPTTIDVDEDYEKEMTKKKDEVEEILIRLITSLHIDIPSNIEDIVQYVFEDVCETADPDNWHDGDVAIGFRRWIESKITG